MHPTLLDIADRVLLPYCGDYWLSQSETIYIGPGNERQALHRDDLNWNLAAQLRVPLQISVLVALGDYDAEVGATARDPASHRWPLDKPFDASMSQQVELGHGDALVYLGSLVHGAARTSRLTGGARRCTSRTWSAGSRPRKRCRWASVRPSPRPCRRVRVSSSASPGCPSGPPTIRPRPRSALWQLDADDPQVVDGTFRNR